MQGELFGPYRLDELVGRGGMGDVYRAFDTVKKRTVALKRLPVHLAKDHEYQARFRREAELAARLTEPHIIPIHDYGEIAGQLYIDMRLISGTDLADLIRQTGPLPPARAVAIIAQIATALAAAHAARLVHRDVKPSNVLISETDRGEDFVHLVDFGIARSDSATALTATGATIGTADYMAPEQFGAGPLDHRVDVYALGCVLHEALTATKPFTGGVAAKMYAHLHTPPPAPSQVRPGVPVALDHVVARAMAKNPEHRFATTTELAINAQHSLQTDHPAAAPAGGTTTVRRPPPPPPRFAGQAPRTETAVPGPPPRFAATPPAPVPPPPAPAPAPSGGGRRRAVVAIAITVVVIAAVAGLALYLRPTDPATTATTPGTAGSEVPTSEQGSPANSSGTAQALEVGGFASGTLTSATATCMKLGGDSWSWTVKGSIDDATVEITFNTNYFRGAGDYNTTSITDERGGFMTMYAGTAAFITGGANTGKFTVADDQLSGTIDTSLSGASGVGGDQQITVNGSWRCS
ncbi:serine/threonine-protein kinase [Pseudonocardia sp. TRM90224]|uniref:serine/threonine-protein kinase n=1 Tax=Pseudonocardia sp. TRM90224 TaxID=2812678 RepID=UPI001E63AB3F|nr:serine/threonine-protein kinase [Pseudonocardia sp. TRM90224]